jgi:hypothetical protein
LNKVLYLIHFLVILSLTSCNPFENGRIIIDINDEDASKATSKASISNIELINDELVITGTNLDSINQTKISGNSIDQVLSVISNTGTQLKLSSGSALALVLNSAFDLIFTDAHGSTIVSVTFNVVDGSITTAKIADNQITTAKLADGSVSAAKLDSMSAGVGQVIKYNGTTWVASDLGALTYAGSWNASTGTEPNNAPSGGEYYIVTTGDTAVDIGDGAGPRNWAVGDWIIYNSVSSQWDKIDNASYVTSFNSRSGAIIPQANDYTWAQIDKTTAPIGDLSDVNVTGAVSGSVLKYDGSNWIVGTDNDTAGSGTSDLGSATNSTINADNDGNGSGAISFQVNSSEVGGFANNGNFSVDTNTLVVDAAADKVGIGVLAPTYDLSFSGDADKAIGAERHTTSDTEGSDFYVYSSGATVGATDKNGGDLLLASGTSTGSGSSNIYFGTASAGASGTTDNTPTTKMTILGNGNVGIGVLAPSHRLDVDGDIYVTSGNDICITGGNCLSSVSAGETNFASNVGSAGVGVFKQKSSATFQFKNINAGSSKVTITDDTANDEIDIDIAEANINHDGLSGFIANEHIDHSSVSIATGANSGLIGGGDLTSTRNLSVDINGTTAETSIASSDEVLIYDSSNTALRKITRANFINGLASSSTTITTGDGLTGGGDLSSGRTLSVDLATNPGLEFSSNQLTVKAGTGVTLDASGVNVDVGTSAGKIVQLNGSGQLPALDGSLLTNLSATSATSAELLANTTDAVINADSDSNGTGDIHFQIDGTEMASIENSGDFLIDTNTLVVDASTDRIGLGVLLPSYDLSINGNGNHQIGMERHATSDTAGGDLTINAGGATTAATDKNGGDLVLVSGTATGTGSSNIYFQTATAQGSTNTTDNTPNTKMTILGSGNVGIGVLAPTTKLAIAAGTDDTIASFSSSDNKAELELSDDDTTTYLAAENSLLSMGFNSGANASNLNIDSSGNIGIGTTSPSGKLDIEGGDVFIGAGTLTNASGSEDLSVSGNLEVDGIIYGDGSGLTNLPSGTVTSITGGAGLSDGPITSSGTIDVNVDDTTIEINTDALRLKDGGITNAKVNATAAIDYSKLNIADGDLTIAKTSGLQTALDAKALATRSIASGDGLSGGGDLSADRTLAVNVDNSTIEINADTLRVKDNGITNAKINSVAHTKVTTACTDGQILSASSGNFVCANASSVGNWTLSGSDIYYNGGNVGIGTTNPAGKLQVVGNVISSNGTADRSISITPNSNTMPASSGIQTATSSAGPGTGPGDLSIFPKVNGKFHILTGEGSGRLERLSVIKNGNVGIGTTSPNEKLSIEGIISLKESAPPSSTSNYGKVYVKSSDSKLYFMNDSGIETDLTGISGGFTMEDWQTPTFENGWGNYGSSYNTAGYYKDPLGTVHLKGMVSGGTVGDSVCIFTLPASYRPAQRELFATETDPNVNARLDIDATGCIIPMSAATGWITLDGLTFKSSTGGSFSGNANPWSISGSNTSYTAGNVGIGTTTPTETLEVNGNVKMGYEQVSADCASTTTCSVSCTAGKRVTGGGCLRVNGPSAGIMDNYGSTTSWTCRWSASMITARAYAYCSNIR